MSVEIKLPSNKTDYENIGQTEAQYRLLYGDEKKWSLTTKAVYDILFKGAYRSTAKREHGIKAQTIFAFLVRNKQKHDSMFELAEIQTKYEEAGK